MYSSPLPDIIVGLGPFRVEDEAEVEASGETSLQGPTGLWHLWVGTVGHHPL